MTPERFRTLQAALDQRQPDLTILAENVRNPHNVAAMLRTSDAVGALELHAVAPAGGFERPRNIAGGTRGWVRTVNHRDIASAVGSLKDHGFHVIAAHFSDSSRDFRELDYTGPTAFLMGSELRGVSPEAAQLADHLVVIPMRGLAESLNVSVAAALLLYEALRQRERSGAYQRPGLPAERRAQLLFEWCYPQVADRCRRHGLPYPPLDADGDITGNPFQPRGVPARASGSQASGSQDSGSQDSGSQNSGPQG